MRVLGLGDRHVAGGHLPHHAALEVDAEVEAALPQRQQAEDDDDAADDRPALELADELGCASRRGRGGSRSSAVLAPRESVIARLRSGAATGGGRGQAPGHARAAAPR